MIEAPADLRSALLNGDGLIDVRAPVECAQGSLPGAVNLPLLSDEQRAAVGLRYKAAGQEAAIALGETLVTGEDRERKMQAWLAAAQARPNAWICCFRGGLRSRSVSEALRKAGHARPILEGGYKRARRFLMQASAEASRTALFRTLSGRTGSGKTEILRKLRQARLASRARPIDLEGLACHRGSAFGSLRKKQASQATFENTLALQLWRLLEEDPNAPIVVEDESRRIGRVEVPQGLFERISTSSVYLVEEPIEKRARFLAATYLADYADVSGSTEQPAGFCPNADLDALLARPLSAEALDALANDVRRALLSIERRLGGAETAATLKMAEAALDEHRRTGSAEAHVGWARRLLGSYYDPLYDKHLSGCASRVVARGDADEILNAIASASEPSA